MRSIVDLNIQGPRDLVAALFADPMNNPKWMDEIDRCEPIAGAPGSPGSTYRLVPRSGKKVFVATVLARDLPREVRLQLDASDVTVRIADRFSVLSENATRLVSEEEFRFKSALGRLMGFVAQPLIRRAHRRHMVSFKRFAEDWARNGNVSST